MFEWFKEWRRSRFHLKTRRLYGGHRHTAAMLGVAQEHQKATQELHEHIHAGQEARMASIDTSFKDPRNQDLARQAEVESKAKLEPLMDQDTQAAEQLTADRQKDYDKELKKATKHYARHQDKYYDAAVEDMREAGMELKTNSPEPTKESKPPRDPGIKLG